jgi:hypothetical protein
MLGRRLGLWPLMAVSVWLVSGCGGGGSGPATPTIAPARSYHLEDFEPTRTVAAGRPTEVRLKIVLPSGATLKRYRTGVGPHTGVDLIIVRQGADALIYTDTTVGKDGVAREDVTLPAPGRYRVIVDAYPDQAGVPRNFQLFRTIRATGGAPVPVLPRSSRSVTVSGYRFTIQGHPSVKAIEPVLMTITVTDLQGRPARLDPYESALAHAIFIRLGSLDYFHTHVCSPSLPGCTTLAGAPPVGKVTGAGRLRLGLLLPLPGTWRLFLFTRPNGRVVMAPFTLQVH